MIYKKTKSQKPSLATPSVTGATISATFVQAAGVTFFYPWQPSTWPPAPTHFDRKFVDTLKRIFEGSMLEEIDNTIADIEQSNGGLEHRGHVVAVALMCALDSIASYAYRGEHVRKFVEAHFPASYKSHAKSLYVLYRNSLIHKWNLFEAAILPGNETITVSASGIPCFGLLNFRDSLRKGVGDFLKQLETDTILQQNTLKTYAKLRCTAKI